MRFPLPDSNSAPNFIGSWLIQDSSICDELIEYFEANKGKHQQGEMASGKCLESKNSIDLTILPHNITLPENKCFQTYFKYLFQFYSDYSQQWPFLKTFVQGIEIGRFNIQRYEKNQHFQRIHAERSSIASLHRLFAWMTYLNDVSPEDGGSTIFTHYGLELHPQKGQTLIWPAEWTHAHKGSILKGNSKYIITGWMHFPA